MDHKHDRSTKWGALFAWSSLSMLPIIAACSHTPVIQKEQIAAHEQTQLMIEPAKPHFTGLPEGDTRKQAFIEYFLPLVQDENARIANLRKQLESTQRIVRAGALLTDSQVHALQAISDEFGIEFNQALFESDPNKLINNLLIRVDEVPTALAIAQSAIESGWGTSRFSVQGNNYFGHMCEEDGCGISSKALGPNQQALKFHSPRDAVRSYLVNINSNPAYNNLRNLRAELRDQGRTPSGCVLANGLNKYSERGRSYVDQVKNLIRANNLEDENACKLNLGRNNKRVTTTGKKAVPVEHTPSYQLARTENSGVRS